MALYKIPVFEKGSVLSHDMLNKLKNLSFIYNNLMYKDYSDGILKGFEITALDQMLQIEPGVFVYQREVYVLDSPLKLSYASNNSWQMVVISMGQKGKEKNYTIQDVDIVVKAGAEAKSNEIEIARFNMQSGAMLRTEYRNFQDTNTQFDTLNLLHAKWAGYQRETLSPVIMNLFAQELIKFNITNADDYSFAQTILSANGNAVNKTAIELYISKRLQRTFTELKNEEIYNAFCEILNSSPKEGGFFKTSRMRENRRIIVD